MQLTQHIFWIADQAEKASLNGASQPQMQNGRPRPYRLDKTGSHVNSLSTFSLVKEVGVDDFERRCNVPLRGGSEDRRRKINYLLSVFEPSDQLPSEFHDQERETHPDRRQRSLQ